MNTNSNLYTVIYSTVLVVVVAAVLAFAAMALKPLQDENVKVETITKVLTAAAQADESVTVGEDTDVMKMYAERIIDAFFVDGNGKKVGSMNLGKENLKEIEVASTGDLKKQNDIIKQVESGKTDLLASMKLPVYVFDINGKTVSVMPCYGAGLWGPIWGYIAVAEDGKTLDGAIFDHKSETPGLGAKITEEAFYGQFRGKVFGDGDDKFKVVKGGAKGAANGVDAISGATITSEALGKTIDLWAKYYQPYFAKSGKSVPAMKCVPATPVAGTDGCDGETCCSDSCAVHSSTCGDSCVEQSADCGDCSGDCSGCAGNCETQNVEE